MDDPDKYMKGPLGTLVPRSKVRPEDIEEDDLVWRLVNRAEQLQAELAEFRKEALGDALAFKALVTEKYGGTKGGAKGNMTLRAYDGSLEMQIQVSEFLTFGPALAAAKELIDSCIARWSEGANDNISALVNHAFQTNKAGAIDTGRVLGLRRLEISDPEWKSAMSAISDAVRVVGSKTYIRFYKVDPETGERTPISLDFARV